MLTNLILTVISQDKPGIVEAVAQIVAHRGGNWLESRLIHLAGKFAGVVRIQIEKERQQELIEALRELRSKHINILIDESESSPPLESSQIASFQVVGPDRPGIVKEISQAFTQYNINVEELTSRYSSTPYSGEPLFEAEGKLQLLDTVEIDDLEDRLEEIADNLAIDISIKLLTP